MPYTTDGLVLRMKKVGENDKLLTLLTPEEGRISVLVKGGRSLKSGSLSATELFTYGNYEITDKNGYKWLRGASSESQFSGLSRSVEKVALASYIAEVAEELSGENEPAEDILRLVLNSYYAMDKDKKPLSQIKSVFELRAAALSGFMPDLHACRGCDRNDCEAYYLDVMNGRLLCSECMHRASLSAKREMATYEDIREAVVMLPLSPSVLAALRYVLEAEPSRILSFTLEDYELDGLSKVCETYLLSHLGHGFDTLDFYKMIL